MTDQSLSTKYKFVIVLNKKLDPGVAINAASHMAACMVAKANEEDRKNMFFVDYEDGNGNKHPVSGLSLVILKAKNSNQIRTSREMAKAEGIFCVDFTETMTQDTYVEQMERTKKTPEDQLEYWGLCLFGEKSKVDNITGKFSLWKYQTNQEN